MPKNVPIISPENFKTLPLSYKEIEEDEETRLRFHSLPQKKIYYLI